MRIKKRKKNKANIGKLVTGVLARRVMNARDGSKRKPSGKKRPHSADRLLVSDG